MFSRQKRWSIEWRQDVGQCYEPGKHVYVTVGIKPETIAAAGQLGENMKTIKNLDDIKGSNQSEIGGNKVLKCRRVF